MKAMYVKGVTIEGIAIICCALLISFMLTIIGCGGDGGNDDDSASVDAIAPTVEQVLVAGDLSAAATNGIIIVVFSEAVEPFSVQAAIAFTPPVNGAASYDEATNTLTFNPASDLQANTGYSVTVSNATDKSGNVMEPYTFQIQTSVKDVEPPEIVGSTPADGEEEASIIPGFSIEFSERIDQTKFGLDLSLTPDVGVPVSQWTFTWSEDGKQVDIWFPLTKGLEPDEKYKLSIGKLSVVDLAGNKMSQKFQIEFTTTKRLYEDIDPESGSPLSQEWIYVIWKQNSAWYIYWGGTAIAGATLRGQGTIYCEEGEIDNVVELAWEAGDTQSVNNGRLTFNGAVNGTGGTDGLSFEATGPTVTFQLSNANPEWIFIGKDRKHPEVTTFTLVND